MLLKLVNKNMPGSVATDFEFIDSSGKDQNLHQIKAPEKLLVFMIRNVHIVQKLLSK